MPKVSGNLLGLEVNGQFIACETSCEFTYEVEMRGASSVISGRWKEVIPGVRSWAVSLNANLMLEAAGANVQPILDAVLSGDVVALRFKTRPLATDELVISGKAFVSNGGISGPVNANANFNTTFTGSGPFSTANDGFFKATFGYTDTDPFGNEINLIPQFSKEFAAGATQIDFDFTKPSAGKFLFAIIPDTQQIFNLWENSQFNFGQIPDQAWREPVNINGKNYYVSRSRLYITSEVPVIKFVYKNLTPPQFYFNDQIDVLRSTIIVSNEVSPLNVTEPVPISVAGGEYQKNADPWTSNPGFASATDVVKVRVTSSPDYDTQTSVTLTMGGVSDAFDVTTVKDLTVYYAYRGDDFTKNNCPINTDPTTVTFQKQYTSTIDQEDADNKAANDPDFDTEGQAYANANGSCQVPTYYIWGKIFVENPQTSGAITYADIYLRTYKGTSATVAPDSIPGNLIGAYINSISIRLTNTQNSQFSDFSVNAVGDSTTQVAPGSTPLYPKQPIKVKQVVGEVFFNYIFPGKAVGEMMLLKVVTPT